MSGVALGVFVMEKDKEWMCLVMEKDEEWMCVVKEKDEGWMCVVKEKSFCDGERQKSGCV